MFNNTTPRDYIVVVRLWPDKHRPASEDFEVPTRAYDIMEANMSAFMQFEADHGFPSDNGGKIKIIAIRPAGAAPADLLASMLKGGRS